MLDRAIINQLIADISEDVFLRLGRQFLEETAGRLASIKASRAAEQLTELARHAHSLKSTSQSFGLQRTGRLAQALQLAGDNRDQVTIDQLLPMLNEVAAEECREFEAFCAEIAVSLRSDAPSSGVSDRGSRG